LREVPGRRWTRPQVSPVPSKRIAVVQSSYIPWKGYFDLIRGVDEFVLFDDVQYTRRDWRNRNRIKATDGLKWLTIPVDVKGRYLQRIRDTTVADASWAAEHWQTIVRTYGRAPHFAPYRSRFELLYERVAGETQLSRINRAFLDEVCAILGIATSISWSMDYQMIEGKTERLVNLCQQAGATEYLSGPSARDYISADAFERAGIALNFADYSAYPEYPQMHPPFEHGVSILDLIFNVGAEEAPKYMLNL
jgi:hypothetical protein